MSCRGAPSPPQPALVLHAEACWLGLWLMLSCRRGGHAASTKGNGDGAGAPTREQGKVSPRMAWPDVTKPPHRSLLAWVSLSTTYSERRGTAWAGDAAVAWGQGRDGIHLACFESSGLF